MKLSAQPKSLKLTQTNSIKLNSIDYGHVNKSVTTTIPPTSQDIQYTNVYKSIQSNIMKMEQTTINRLKRSVVRLPTYK
jgi:uncharacterized membrane protein